MLKTSIRFFEDIPGFQEGEGALPVSRERVSAVVRGGGEAKKREKNVSATLAKAS